MYKLRPAQQLALQYRRGKMGISAVPGSGKTFTLSALAARLVAEGGLQENQEVLVVTFANSAVDNIALRIGQFVEESGLLANLGYRVRTLHGLAHDIIRERPALAGLESQFQILDEFSADGILKDTINEWLHTHPTFEQAYLDSDQASNRYVHQRWVDLVNYIAASIIKTAKDLQYTPGMIRLALQDVNLPLPLLEMALDAYTTYQRGLSYRGAVDFSDLVFLALQALQNDPDYLARLRHRWPYILEDEAQDSSELQEKMLRLLAGPDGNWVRVGDTNQAIYDTFTTSSPRFLRNFLQEPDVTALTLPQSGRSQPGIIRLANHLVEWACQSHPAPEGREALTQTYILPVGKDDPKPNPEENLRAVYCFMKSQTSEEEINLVVRSLAKWIPEHPDLTTAVLVDSNSRGAAFVEKIKAANLPCLELLRSTQPTREAVSAVQAVLKYLEDKKYSDVAAGAFQAWYRYNPGPQDSPDLARDILTHFSNCTMAESFINPVQGKDWLLGLAAKNPKPGVVETLQRYRSIQQRWHAAAVLPIGQLVLTVSQDLFHEPPDLATASKLAGMLALSAREHPEWGLADFARDLDDIIANRRRYYGLREDDQGFNPEEHRGKVVVATFHKAKGLEFDRVYITSANNYQFPSGEAHDQYYDEKWFVKDQENLPAVALHQLKMLMAKNSPGLYAWGEAGRVARGDVIAERLRLLYVAITRAKREVVLTWNSGRKNDCTAALPLQELARYWQEVLDAQP